MSDNKQVAVGKIIVNEDRLNRDRDKDNYYPTPRPFVRWLLKWLLENHEVSGFSQLSIGTSRVLDVGAGDGNWGMVASQFGFKNIYGVELNYNRFAAMDNHWDAYRIVMAVDVMDMSPRLEPRYDLVFGNPPYQKKRVNPDYEKGLMPCPSTGEIVAHALNLLRPSGAAVFLLPSDFAHSQERWKMFFHMDRFKRSSDMPYAVLNLANRVNFYTENGLGGSYPGEYSVFIWRNDKPEEEYTRTYTLKWG